MRRPDVFPDVRCTRPGSRRPRLPGTCSRTPTGLDRVPASGRNRVSSSEHRGPPPWMRGNRRGVSDHVASVVSTEPKPAVPPSPVSAVTSFEYQPIRVLMSVLLTPAAPTWMSTSPGAGCGTGTSVLYSSFSNPPWPVRSAAAMVFGSAVEAVEAVEADRVTSSSLPRAGQGSTLLAAGSNRFFVSAWLRKVSCRRGTGFRSRWVRTSPRRGLPASWGRAHRCHRRSRRRIRGGEVRRWR